MVGIWARRGDPAAGDLAGLYDRYARALQHYLARRYGAKVADGLVADVFVEARRQRVHYDSNRAPARARLYGIATDLGQQYARSEVDRLRVTATYGVRAADTADTAARIGSLAGRLAGLPDGDRDALLLAEWAGLEPIEVAHALGLPVGTVRSWLRGARAALCAEIGAGVEAGTGREREPAVAEVWTGDQLDEMLRALHVNEPPMSEDAFRAGRLRLSGATAVEAGGRPIVAGRRAAARWSRRHPLALAAATLLLVVGLGAAVLVVSRDDRGTPLAAPPSPPAPSPPAPSPPAPSPPAPSPLATSPPATATTVVSAPVTTLDDLAARCADPSLAAGQYRFFEYRRDGGSEGYDDVFRMWIPSEVTGDWLLRTHQGEGDPQPAEELRGAYPGPSTGGTDGLWSTPTPWFYADLPRAPRALYDELTRSTAGEAFAQVAHRIRWITLLPPPADLRAALVRALAYHDPPAAVRDGIRTRDGRRAVAIRLPYPGTDVVLELLFDPGDCQVLGSQTATSGGVISSVTVRLAVVGTIGDLP